MTENRPDATVTVAVDDGPIHAIKAFFAALLSEILGYLIAIPALIGGFILGIRVIEFGFFNSLVLGLAISIALGWILNKVLPLSEDQIRTGFFKIPTVEETLKRRGKWKDRDQSSNRAESNLRHRLVEKGLRSQSQPQSPKESDAS